MCAGVYFLYSSSRRDMIAGSKRRKAKAEAADAEGPDDDGSDGA